MEEYKSQSKRRQKHMHESRRNTYDNSDVRSTNYQTLSSEMTSVIQPDNDEFLDTESSSDHNINSINDSGRTDPRHQLRRVSSFWTPGMEDRLKRKLKFFFMGPVAKFKARRNCPWKLSLQIIKIFIVTTQMILFGFERSEFVDYVQKNNLALRHLYLKGWDQSEETMPYPPATGQYALYDIATFKNHVNYAVAQYYKTPDIALGLFHFNNHTETGEKDNLTLCVDHFNKMEFNDDDTYSLDIGQTTTCTDIPNCIESLGKKNCSFDVFEYLDSMNHSIQFDRFLRITLKFKLKTYRLNINRFQTAPECFFIKGNVIYDDENQDGQMIVNLLTTLAEISCQGDYNFMHSEELEKTASTIFDVVVILTCFISSILCSRSLVRAQKLRKKTQSYFMKRFRKELTTSEKMSFLNLWFVLIIVNDLLTVVGSSLKISIENKNVSSSSEMYDICSIMLGTGNILAWFGVLRYLGFFKTFNILVITLKKSSPDMMRFIISTLFIYAGFLFGGWVILGPYHIKFKTLSSTSECLFSLINGDDMFVTFSATVTKNSLVWYFSRIYLYVFISLFIYAVLNLFSSVILDSYETIKEYYREGFPKSFLFQFIDECTDPPNSAAYRREKERCDILSTICCCRKRRNPDDPNEYTSLLH